jgi:hypothetical protein
MSPFLLARVFRQWIPLLVPSIVPYDVVAVCSWRRADHRLIVSSSPTRAFTVAPSWCGLGRRSRIDGIIHLTHFYRQSSARIGHAVAKASVMRILGVPRLPLSQLLPSALLTRSCPCQADSFSPPVPLTYASSLSSLPPLHPLIFPVLCSFSIMPLCP